MRVVAQAKLGFYPAHPDVVALIASHLRMPGKRADEVHIIDPCAGEGRAIKQIADALGVPPARTFAVELDAGRADTCREVLGPEAHVLGPASFMGTRIAGGTMGLVYCNPPFDDELGGGKRQEYTFAEKSARLLKVGGVLVLVMPITAIMRNDRFQDFLDCMFEDACLYQFPAEHRKYQEVVYIGKRRLRELPSEDRYRLGTLCKLQLYSSYRPDDPVIGSDADAWEIPWTWAPHVFEKVMLTDAEMVEAIRRSPLAKLFDPPAPNEPTRPPMPLVEGHVAQLLASGMLDGLVEPEDEPPHVVRGTSIKVDYVSSRTPIHREDGEIIGEKVIRSQKIMLTVRAVSTDGVIRTFDDGSEAKPAETADDAESDAA